MSVINPGSVTLSTWRDIYQGEKASLDPSCLDAVARSAAFVAQIAAKDQAVYGINTGFGLLASIGIAPEDLQTLHRDNDRRVQDPYCLRCQPQVMGAVLDLLRQAGTTLEIEANGVSDNPLIFADDGEVISGGNFHAEPVAFAADMIAMVLCEIGSLSERRLAMLIDPALSGLPAFLTPNPGLNSGFMIPQVTAAALVSENKQRAYPASVDSIPTSANQEDRDTLPASGEVGLRQDPRGFVAAIAFGLGKLILDFLAFGNEFAKLLGAPHQPIDLLRHMGAQIDPGNLGIVAVTHGTVFIVNMREQGGQGVYSPGRF